jgi:hypothetical protein
VRYRIGVAWALAIVAPDVFAWRWPHDRAAGAVWLVSCLASLVAWLVTVEALAALRRRRAWAAWPPLLLLAAFVPLALAATNRYFATMHGCLPPSAVWFGCRNPRYAYVLAFEATTPLERALLLASPIALLALLLLATRRPLPPPPRWLGRRTRLVAAAALALLLVLPRAARTADLEGLRATIGGVALFAAHARPHLGAPARLHPSPLPPAADHPNVVVIVQESLGAWQWAPWNHKADSSPRIVELLERDAPAAAWFSDAVTAAGATAVSLPTILTGLGPDASGDDFTRAPLLWQEARALGYRTALVSAQDWDWLSFRSFFLGADAPDVAKTALELGAARVNDSGVDDAAAAAEVARFVDATPTDRPFLVVMQLNSTHRPCWAPDVDAAPSLPDRCLHAARYVDDAVLRVIDHLRARGRLEDTLILGTADHGESFRGDRPARLESYYEDVTRVPLWVRLPARYVARHPDAPAALAAATRTRVSNLDLFPTVLDVWGRWPLPADERPRLVGASLLRAIDPDRVLVVASTGDIHDFRWSNEGFALYHGRWKWLCDERGGCRLFDIERDPAEEHDLRAAAPPAERARFDAEIAARPNLRRILVEMHETTK